MPALKGRYYPARDNQAPENPKVCDMRQCWMRWSEWPWNVAAETID